MTAALALAIGFAAVHALGCIVYVACRWPVWIPGHETTLRALPGQED